MTSPDPHGPPHVRRPQTGSFEAVAVPDGPNKPIQYVPGEFIHHRHLDPVRAKAVELAVQLVTHRSHPDDDPTTAVLLIAPKLERYLTGEEADSQ